MNEVRGVKLMSGDELVGRIESTAGGIIIEEPRALRGMQTPQGPVLGLVPWIITASDSALKHVTINGHALATAPFDVTKEVHDDYVKQTTGIVLAT